MTIDNKELVKKIIKANGVYDDDPTVIVIYSYINMEGRETQAVFYDWIELKPSLYVREPKLLWTINDGLTQAGKEWIK